MKGERELWLEKRVEELEREGLVQYQKAQRLILRAEAAEARVRELARLREALESMVNCPVGGSGQRLPTPETVAKARAALAPEVTP